MIVLGVFGFGIVKNQFHADYQLLSEIDQKVLSELEQCFQAEKDTPLWEGYRLSEKTIVAVNGRWGDAYIVNPKVEPKSLFAQKIRMPEKSSLNAYRVAFTSPQLLQFRGLADFNNISRSGEALEKNLLGNQVYYTRYTEKSVNGPDYSSGHYLTFLAHEAFHFYMQGEWSTAGRFDTELMKDEALDQLEDEYIVLSKMQEALQKKVPDRHELTELCKEYVAVVEKRLSAKNGYDVKPELQAETEEGTATYVGIQASKIIGYPFDVMCVAQRDGTIEKNYPFSEVVKVLRGGDIDSSVLSSNLVYETGALLCQVMDVVGPSDWQTQLNRQTKSSQTTLFEIIQKFVNNK